MWIRECFVGFCLFFVAASGPAQAGEGHPKPKEGGAPPEALVVDERGRVGIGTGQPQHALELRAQGVALSVTAQNTEASLRAGTRNVDGEGEVYLRLAQDPRHAGTQWHVGVASGGAEGSKARGILSIANLEARDRGIFANADGKVRIGSQDFTGDALLQVAGAVSAKGVTESSDRRFKKDVAPIDGALSRVQQLRGVQYRDRDEAQVEGPGEIGLIGQEVETVVPEVVETDDRGYKSVAYARLVPLLVEAVKAQQVQIEALQRQVCALAPKDCEAP